MITVFSKWVGTKSVSHEPHVYKATWSSVYIAPSWWWSSSLDLWCSSCSEYYSFCIFISRDSHRRSVLRYVLTVESKNAPLDAWGSERSPQPCICCAVNGKYCRVGSCGGETGDCETSGFGKSSRKEKKKKEPEKSMDMGKVITERLYMSQRLKKSNPKRLPCLLILCSFPFPPLSETCPD